MRFSVKAFVFVLLLSTISFSQELTREQKLQKIEELNNQLKSLETDVLLPDVRDIKQAEREGLQVFRLLPRERYDHQLTVQGGGSYYSFTTRSHDYRKIPQIGLEQNYLKVGFAGLDYGFIGDLGNIPLANVSTETTGINFLVNYKPPAKESEIRAEEFKSRNYQTENIVYRTSVPVSLENTYALRAISFDRADVLVAFKIYRQDADGSLIVFWKLLENFETPKFIRNQEAVSTDNSGFIAVDYSGGRAAKIEAILRKRGFTEVKVSEEDKLIVLRGKIPKGKLAEALSLAIEANEGKPVKNQLTED